jgi:hypothetical protein
LLCTCECLGVPDSRRCCQANDPAPIPLTKSQDQDQLVLDNSLHSARVLHRRRRSRRHAHEWCGRPYLLIRVLAYATQRSSSCSPSEGCSVSHAQACRNASPQRFRPLSAFCLSSLATRLVLTDPPRHPRYRIPPRLAPHPRRHTHHGPLGVLLRPAYHVQHDDPPAHRYWDARHLQTLVLHCDLVSATSERLRSLSDRGPHPYRY